MVFLNWENKRDIIKDIDEKRKIYKNYFECIDLEKGILKKSFDLIQALIENKNILFWGDNLKVLYCLLNYLEDKIDLIYIDPPFYSGSNYTINMYLNGKKREILAYNDNWRGNLDEYLQMIYERIILFRKLLSSKGLLVVHLDWHVSHYVRVILDEIFGKNRFVNNIVWYYYNKYSAGKKNLPRAHDDILIYSRSNNYQLNELRLPREKPIKQLKRKMVNGVLKNVKDKNGKVVYRIVVDKKLDDVWKIPCLQPASREWTGFPTQKHHELLERIIKLCSNENDLIADFFAGSGTTLLEAQKLNRRWIGCDTSEISIYLTCKRIKNYLKKVNLNRVKKIPLEVFTRLDYNKKKILNSGFFKKDIKIRRN
ncbi:MAG: DNA methyltransferase [Promethearchaeota archaeon]